MSRGVYRWLTAMSLVAVAIGAQHNAWSQPVHRGPAIRFSDAKDDTVSTNVSALTDRSRDNLKRLEEHLNRPFQPMGGGAEFGGGLGVTQPPAGPMIQSKKIRELLDRKNNWAFAKPEDQMKDLSGDELLNTPQLEDQGNDKSEKTVIEQWLTQRDATSTNGTADGIWGSRDRQDEFEPNQEFTDPRQNAVRKGLSQTEQSLRLLVNQEAEKISPDFGQDSVMPDLFDTKSASSWQTRAQEIRMDQFKQSLQAELPQPASLNVLGTPSGGTGLGSGLPSTGGYLGGGLSSSQNLTPPMAAPSASSFSSAGLSASPGLSSPSFSPVRPSTYNEPARSQKPPSLFPEIPRRRF